MCGRMVSPLPGIVTRYWKGTTCGACLEKSPRGRGRAMIIHKAVIDDWELDGKRYIRTECNRFAKTIKTRLTKNLEWTTCKVCKKSVAKWGEQSKGVYYDPREEGEGNATKD